MCIRDRTDNVYLAVGNDTANGIDMTDFENDGYVLLSLIHI